MLAAGLALQSMLIVLCEDDDTLVIWDPLLRLHVPEVAGGQEASVLHYAYGSGMLRPKIIRFVAGAGGPFVTYLPQTYCSTATELCKRDRGLGKGGFRATASTEFGCRYGCRCGCRCRRYRCACRCRYGCGYADAYCFTPACCQPVPKA